ncbi:MAG: creatininase family protein [Staphylothermus sp.]|nr:creatininase family protein [Staphylothermus sp.]
MLYDLSHTRIVKKEDNNRIATIPFGSMEYHGGALPLLTDTLIAENISRKCLNKYKERNNVTIYLYPGMYLGFSHEWLRYSGTISLEPNTYLALIDSIVKSIDENIDPHGYIFINGHGGNYSLLEAYARKYYFSKRKPVIIIDLWRIAGRYGLHYCHACREEVMLYKYLVEDKANEAIIDESASNEVSLNDHLRGFYQDMSIGSKGSLNISIEEYVCRVCDTIDSAIKHIIDQS